LFNQFAILPMTPDYHTIVFPYVFVRRFTTFASDEPSLLSFTTPQTFFLAQIKLKFGFSILLQ